MPLFALALTIVIPSLMDSLRSASTLCNRFLMQLPDIFPVCRDSPIISTFMFEHLQCILLHDSSERYLSSFTDPTWVLPLNTSVTPYFDPPRLLLFASRTQESEIPV